MKYISTRGGIAPLTFRETVMEGLARDGGLMLPGRIPDVRRELVAWRKLSYAALACEVTSPFTDLSADALQDLVMPSYAGFRHPDVTPLVRVGDRFILELFHGPTLAFKDVALQFLGRLFESVLVETRAEMNILGATSGDTGSAAIHGVRGRTGIRIFILHPRGRVSPVQELQMTSVLDANVFNIAVDGTFDDCQGLVKAAFGDLAFRDRCRLGAVNSINWARVLAQVVYYFYAAFRAMDATGASRVRVTVPTGNFGDVFAGYIAVRMGLPVSRLILATNENDILSRFFNEGVYRIGRVHATLSPSMDIQIASNFERYLYYAVGEEPARLRALMADFTATGVLRLDSGGNGFLAAGACDRKGTLAAIRETYARHGYLLDPHTAVGVSVSERFMDPREPMICLATAHPAKFPDAIREALGQDLARHPLIEALAGLPTRCDTMPASVETLKAYVAARTAGDANG